MSIFVDFSSCLTLPMQTFGVRKDVSRVVDRGKDGDTAQRDNMPEHYKAMTYLPTYKYIRRTGVRIC